MKTMTIEYERVEHMDVTEDQITEQINYHQAQLDYWQKAKAMLTNLADKAVVNDQQIKSAQR